LRRVIATCVALICLTGAFSGAAADISVMVVDPDGHGVGEVVVTATPVVANMVPRLKPAVMDQRNLAFAPRVLVVGVGTSVEFPNTHQLSGFYGPPSNDAGHSWTFAGSHECGAHWQFVTEWLRVVSRFPPRVALGESATQVGSQFQLAVRYQFNLRW
jgi:hypothetical protein